MNCKWCDKELTDSQVYEYLRGKTKGNSCGKKCSMLLLNYKNKEEYLIKNTRKCKVCNKDYFKEQWSKSKVCSINCASVLSSKRMKKNNPMSNEKTRLKVSERLKTINHKPFKQGGNGRGATNEQLILYNEITKIDDSFVMEYIELTRGYREQYKTPTHYKIDIASKIYKIAIEIDGPSHQSLKVKECDKRKTKVLNLKGWKVLRLSNTQIQKELMNCVKMVMSMI